MIDRTFKKLKYQRDYLFNSKKKEKNYFKNFTEDSEGFTWIQYRTNTMKLFDNRLNVIFSWKLFFKKVSCVLAVLGLIELFLNLFIGGIIVALSVVSHLIYLYFKKKEKLILSNYDFALSLIHGQIKEIYNLDMEVNP